jgi:hypothetical protein
LLAGGEDEFRRTFGALQDPIVVFHTLLRSRAGKGVAAEHSMPAVLGTQLKDLRHPDAGRHEIVEMDPNNLVV